MSQELFASVENSLKVLRKEIIAIPELKDNEKNINEIIENMNSPLLVMVMGEFSRGKSTFINALIGQSITKVDAKPTTAVITKLSYGTQDEITVFMRDGSTKSYDIDSFAVLTAEADEDADKLHERIDHVERKMPIDILKTMSIIDSPGLNSIKSVHEETTKNFMDKSDVVIWLFDAQNPGKSTEIDAMKRLNPRLSPLVLVNKMDAVNEDEGDSPEKIISKIKRDLSNNKLEYQKIIGISAKMAFQGKIKNNEKMIMESNIGEFYDTVDTMILPNREQYKRNSMLDELSKIIFSMGNDLNDKREKNKARKSRDYASYIEVEELLAAFIDELENIADTVMTAIESMQTIRRRRLNPAEKTFYGVLYWLGLFVEKNNEQAQQYLEEASVRNDGAAQLILVGVCSRLGQMDKARYWQEQLGIQENVSAETLYEKGEKYYNAKDYANALTCYKESAALGCDEGMNNIGEMYRHGLGVTKDYDEALSWYKKAAELGNAAAMYNIGYMYLLGTGVAKDDNEALSWYKKASELGVADAMYVVGEMYRHGLGVAQDDNEALSWYKKASERGVADAMHNIGVMYQNGLGVVQDDNEALIWYKKAAELGFAAAMHNIGVMYQNGLGVVQDDNEALSWYKKASELGVADAMNNIGEMYRHGLGVAQDDNEALSWYKKSSELGNAFAMHNIGVMYRHGLGVAQDDNEALIWYKKAAELGFAAAMNNIGYMYQDGLGVAQSAKDALSWYKKSSELGCGVAMHNIGCMYQDGLGVAQDDNEALIWYQKAAELGFAGAMNNIGYMYQDGLGVAQDDNEALSWYKKASELGVADAMYVVGEMYRHGLGVAQDDNEALSWYKKAAELGVADAMYVVGEMYRHGLGVVQDDNEALIWYKKAAELGVADAMHVVGAMYRHGLGVAQDHNEALIWYKKAAELGFADAMNNIGVMYRHGLGVAQDYNEALIWYKKAAELGFAAAMHNIGVMYQNGLGVAQDYNEALIWYKKADLHGSKKAMVKLNILRRKLRNSKHSDETCKKEQKKGTCFITTAVYTSFNKPDDCYELSMFRSFRDKWLSVQLDGITLIKEYYRIAPSIVQGIDSCPNKSDIYREIWSQYLRPCLHYIEIGANNKCKELYIKMVKELEKKFG